jgi:hypothetical protein
MLGCAHSAAHQTQSQAGDELSWLVGEWRGDRFEPSTGDRAPVVSVVRSILGGAGEEESLEIKTSKGTYHGLYVQVTESGGKSVIMYVNANRRSFARLEGTARADGGEWVNAAAQGPHRSKLVYEHPSPKTWRRTQNVSEDGGKTWAILFVDELERKR